MTKHCQCICDGVILATVCHEKSCWKAPKGKIYFCGFADEANLIRRQNRHSICYYFACDSNNKSIKAVYHLRHKGWVFAMRIVMPQFGPEPKFKPELCWTGPKVWSKVQATGWTEPMVQSKVQHKVKIAELVQTCRRSGALKGSNWIKNSREICFKFRYISSWPMPLLTLSSGCCGWNVGLNLATNIGVFFMWQCHCFFQCDSVPHTFDAATLPWQNLLLLPAPCTQLWVKNQWLSLTYM
jgi:hypothetical protein